MNSVMIYQYYFDKLGTLWLGSTLDGVKSKEAIQVSSLGTFNIWCSCFKHFMPLDLLFKFQLIIIGSYEQKVAWAHGMNKQGVMNLKVTFDSDKIVYSQIQVYFQQRTNQYQKYCVNDYLLCARIVVYKAYFFDSILNLRNLSWSNLFNALQRHSRIAILELDLDQQVMDDETQGTVGLLLKAQNMSAVNQ